MSLLQLEKSTSKCYVAVGEIVTFTIIARNCGDIYLGSCELNKVTIYDILSSSLEAIEGSVRVNGILKKESEMASGINIGAIAIGESKKIQFKARVLSDEIECITNTANATFVNTIPGCEEEVGYVTSNEVSIIPQLVNIDVVKIADKDFVVLGDIISYTVKLKNTGSLDALNIMFKDTLPSEVELVNRSFSVNGNIINRVKINEGVNIGSLDKCKEVIIKYDVKVIKANCDLQIINEASVKFQYKLPDCTIGFAESEKTAQSKKIITIGINNFKQINITENLIIPMQKPDMEEISEVIASVEILKSHVIKTPTLKSNEGQKLTGYKLVIHGVLNEVVEYTALDDEQSVHSAHYAIPFTTFIVLPENYCIGGNTETKGVIEGIYFKKLDCRLLFTNVTLLVKAGVYTKS